MSRGWVLKVSRVTFTSRPLDEATMASVPEWLRSRLVTEPPTWDYMFFWR